MSKIPFREIPNAKLLVQNDIIGLIAYLPSYFSADECRRICGLADEVKKHDGRIGKGENDEIRNSKVSYLSPNDGTKWIFDKLEHILLDLNKDYKFELNGFREGLQIAEYEAPAGHYAWHNDIGTGPLKTELEHPAQ